MTTAQNNSTGRRPYESSNKIAWQSLDSVDNSNTAETEKQYREFIKEALWQKESSESFHSFVEEVQWYRAH
jgi:hypothetical protein